MKKIFSVLLVMCIAFGSMGMVFAEESDYQITAEGEITGYYGGMWVVVPEEIDGIPVKKIGDEAFFDLGIEDVYLPDGLEIIGNSAFEGCNTMSMTIPSSVTMIGDRAFTNCGALSMVFIEFDENTQIGAEAFFGTGHLLFYLNCDKNTEKLEQMLYEAKGDSNYEIILRHVDYYYDSEGNGNCGYCGYYEKYEEETLPFEDVSEDSWYYDYVKTAYFNGIINGKSKTVFDPDAGMTCAEAAKIAAVIYERDHDAVPAFKGGKWYHPYVNYCYGNGIIDQDVTFDWEKPITRGQMAYIFSHCDPWNDSINNVPLTDIPDVDASTPFVNEILALYNKGIAVGDENMRFYPDSNIKRSEAAAIISRIITWDMRVELPKG